MYLARESRVIMLKIWLALSVAVIAIDQATKMMITDHFSFGDSLPITSFFNLVLAYNTGAAFSFLAEGGGWQRWFFTATASIASIVIIYFLRKHAKELRFCFGLSFILGGALGNLIDRIRLGHVIDFLDFHVAGYHWPAFNVADSAICLGAALLIWENFVSHPGKTAVNGNQ